MEHQIIPKDAASEVIRGEDFSLLNEVAPSLMRSLASCAGKSIGELRKMAADGALTSSALIGRLTIG